MNETRKKIIVNEIINWRKNRMLPEHYCDFLLALYTEGNEPENIKEPATIRKLHWKNHYLFLMLIPLALFLIHFTELSITLQMAFSILFVLAGIIFTFYFIRKGILLQIPIIASALILLLSTVEFISRLFPNSLTVLYIVIILNCLLWLLTGWKLKMPSFILSGVLGMILLVTSIFI
ncbi:hypothetical protein RRV45_15570 [Bacillus sp. DTU_2020_1000418_1_SI_GHA_SEK_038]|uniref:hypothetical protein n=1 Tax=Bacillus sp. DTU_2020_1000418_1_SI_GHA_SEK_038 TaxID=3077585 RepID=UPI0028EF87C6|nr:hypothetical protein [Bacillus sp. DTU_2020_1000418_1_SI_GHA_SEK_038]WNS74328.1 hypothetical protein RRV45_15570 [Bacillus sp. DTU_2020_1000418_1_SI_GHA_SEK_038]